MGRGRLGAQAEGEGLQGFPGVAGVPASSACWPQSFATETLRTLCLACKEVDEEVYEQWWQRHQEASILLQNRAQALQELYEEMEQSLQVGGAGAGRRTTARRELGPCSVCPRPLPPPPQLLGATAIEDRLQDGVLETIKCLKQGNIKVWVLTGDKQGGS